MMRCDGSSTTDSHHEAMFLETFQPVDYCFPESRIAAPGQQALIAPPYFTRLQ